MRFAITPRGDSVVFTAVGEGGRDLFLLDLKTKKVSRIAATPEFELSPAVSPDGSSVVYAAGKAGERADHLYVRTLDGKTVKSLTNADADDKSPEFSPDGSLIVFIRSTNYKTGAMAASGYTEPVLCVMKADGSDLRELTNKSAHASSPHFTADGKSIYFSGLDGLYRVPVDGSAAPNRITVAHSSGDWAFSPDGKSLGFCRGKFSPDLEIFVADADGTNPRQLTFSNRRGCFQPAFTPDGKRILFFVQSWLKGSSERKRNLWEVDVAGGEPREIADYRLLDEPLKWKPGPLATFKGQ